MIPVSAGPLRQAQLDGMKVNDAMTRSPATCAPATSLRLVAQLMSDHDCAAIPIIDSGRLVGLVTDRDIVCRAVAHGSDIERLPAASVMSSSVIAVGPDEPLENAVGLMEENAIHHLAVIGSGGKLVGMLAQSDIGRRLTNREFGELARRTSIRAPQRGRVADLVVRRS